MKTATVTVNDPSGMHARPAGEIVKIVKQFPSCKITLDNSVRKVSALSILSILSLGMKQGSVMTVTAEGEGEEEAVAAVTSYVASLK